MAGSLKTLYHLYHNDIGHAKCKPVLTLTRRCALASDGSSDLRNMVRRETFTLTLPNLSLAFTFHEERSCFIRSSWVSMGSKTLPELRWRPHSAASGPRHVDSPVPDAVCGFPVTAQQPWAEERLKFVRNSKTRGRSKF